jgi:hypothetical protein
MPQCVTVDQINGVDVIVPSTSDPCTTALLLSPTEFAHIAQNPFVLSLEDGAQLSAAIVGVWAVAWCVKALVLALRVDDGDSTST